MRVPIRGGDQGMAGTPGARIGVQASADDFGGANWRDLHNLGGAVHGAGNAVLAEAQRRQRDEDETAVRLARIEARKKYADQEQILRNQYRGNLAGKFPAESENLLRTIREEAGKGLSNRAQRDAFAAAMDAFGGQEQIRAFSYRDGEMESAKQNSLKAENLAISEESGAKAMEPGGIDAVLSGPWLRMLDDNSDKMTFGQGEEVRKQVRADNRRAWHTGNLNALASAPARALEYLADERVGADIPPPELAALKEKYGKARLETEQANAVNQATSRAIELARSGGDIKMFFAELVKTVGTETAQKAMSAYNVWDELGDEERAEAEHAADRERLERERRLAKQEERADAEATISGRALAKDRGMSLEGVRDLAYMTLPEKQAKAMIEVFEAERKAVAADKAVRSAEREKALELEFEAAGWNVAGMPSRSKAVSQGGLTSEEIISFGERSGKIKPQQKPKFDESVYLDALFGDPHETAAKLNDPARRTQFVAALGGASSQMFNGILSTVKHLLPGAGKTGSGEGDSITTLDNDLNSVRRRMEMSLQSSGLHAGDADARTNAVNAAIEFARRMYEDEMAAAGVDDVKKLPLDVRNRIQAEASLVVNIRTPGTLWDGVETVSGAEAWAAGRDVSDAEIKPESLSPELRRNYTGGRIVFEGDTRIAVDVPADGVPETVRDAAVAMRGTVRKNLSSGWFEVVPGVGGSRVFFSADGTVFGREDVPNVQRVESADIDPDILWQDYIR